MTTEQIGAASRHPLTAAFMQIVQAVAAAGILFTATLLWRGSHEAAMLGAALEAKSDQLAIIDAKVSVLESRAAAADVANATQDERLVSIYATLQRIETSIERLAQAPRR